MRRNVDNGTPFFVYFNHSLMHFPVIPREEFNGKRQGRVGRQPARTSTRTLAPWWTCSTALASPRTPSPSYWEGSLFAGGEGNLRTPCIVRWPGHTRSGEVSDEIMYVTDWFTTLLRAAGVRPPEDRVIDGVDQLDWLTGAAPSSQREGYIYWMGQEIYGAKWSNFKLVLVTQKYSTDPPGRRSSLWIINLTVAPQEREPFTMPYVHTRTGAHFNKLIGAFGRHRKSECRHWPARRRYRLLAQVEGALSQVLVSMQAPACVRVLLRIAYSRSPAASRASARSR